MVFSSLIFLYAFFSLSLAAYALCRTQKAQNLVLLVFCLLLCSCQSGGPYTVTFDTNGYNGHLTSREAGYVGGQMVKKMIEAYEQGLQ